MEDKVAQNAIANLTQEKRNRLGLSNTLSEREARKALSNLSAQERADNNLPSLYRMDEKNFNSNGSHTVLMGFEPSEAVKIIETLRNEGFSTDSKVLREEAIRRCTKPIVYPNKVKD